MQSAVDSRLSSFFKSLKINPDHKILQEDEDCCPICLEDIDKYDNINYFRLTCYGKNICRNCDPNFSLKSCPMCRKAAPVNLSLDQIVSIQNNAKVEKSWALYELACYYDSGNLLRSSPFIKKNDKEAFRLFLLSAKKGHRDSQFKTGECYYFGHHVEKSVKESFYWFAIAAKQGSIDAQTNLAAMITVGLIPGSYDDVMLLYQNSAEKGDEIAQFNIALQFLLRKDYKNAFILV